MVVDTITIVSLHAVGNLGVLLDSHVTLGNLSIRYKCNFHLRRISSIRKYITQGACCRPVVSLVPSILDYCNVLLAGLSKTQLARLQRI